MTSKLIVAVWLAVSCLSLDATAQVRGRGYTGITVYEDPNFRGDSVTFRDEVADLRRHGLNDRISSLEITGGQAWELCQDVNFGGRCRVFDGTVDDLRQDGWNDRISSMRAVGFARNGGRGPVWGRERDRGPVWGNERRSSNSSRLVFYSQTNFRGETTTVSSATGNLGSTGDRARSVQLYGGGAWELCDGRSRNARCVTVDRSVADLRSLGLRNGVETVREVSSNGRWW